MDIYRVILQHGALPPKDYSHHETLALAHAAAKDYDKTNDRRYVRIELLDVNVSKAGVLGLLRGYSAQDGSTRVDANVRVKRAWDLSDRGGLRELTDDDLRELGAEIYGDGEASGEEPDVLA